MTLVGIEMRVLRITLKVLLRQQRILMTRTIKICDRKKKGPNHSTKASDNPCCSLGSADHRSGIDSGSIELVEFWGGSLSRTRLPRTEKQKTAEDKTTKITNARGDGVGYLMIVIPE
jgi:hypothetical protein